MEDASGEGEQKCWFGEGGYLALSEMESGSWRDGCQGGLNPATPIYRDKTRSKLDDDDDDDQTYMLKAGQLYPLIMDTTATYSSPASAACLILFFQGGLNQINNYNLPQF